jgi:hypothetical protein
MDVVNTLRRKHRELPYLAVCVCLHPAVIPFRLERRISLPYRRAPRIFHWMVADPQTV